MPDHILYGTKSEEKPTHPCWNCRGTDWWYSIYDLWICRVCHPPMPGKEKKK